MTSAKDPTTSHFPKPEPQSLHSCYVIFDASCPSQCRRPGSIRISSLSAYFNKDTELIGKQVPHKTSAAEPVCLVDQVSHRLCAVNRIHMSCSRSATRRSPPSTSRVLELARLRGMTYVPPSHLLLLLKNIAYSKPAQAGFTLQICWLILLRVLAADLCHHRYSRHLQHGAHYDCIQPQHSSARRAHRCRCHLR